MASLVKNYRPDSVRHPLTMNFEETNPQEDTFWNKVSREVNVVGGGLVDGFKEKSTAVNYLKAAPEIATSAGIGALLALGQGKKGLIRLGCEIAGLAFTAGMVKDLTNKERLSALGGAVSDTWSAAHNMEHNREQVKIHGGQFAFDTALMFAAGSAGASSARAWGPKSELAVELRSSAAGARPIEVANGVPLRRGAFQSPMNRMALVEEGSLGATKKLSSSFGAVASEVATSPKSVPAGALLPKVGETIAHGTTSNGLPAIEVFPANANMTTSPHAHKLAADSRATPFEQAQQVDKVPWQLVEDRPAYNWKPKAETVDVRLTAQEFVDNFMQQRFDLALKSAIEAKVMSRVDLNPQSRAHEFTVKPEELKRPEILQYTMSQLSSMAEFNWRRTKVDGITTHERLQVVVPKTIIALSDGKSPVALVDFAKTGDGYKVVYPETTTSGKALTPSELAEIKSIRQSPEGQRLLAETAIFGFEEGIVHANQHLTASGGIMAPSYAQFARDFTTDFGIKDGVHRKAFLAVMDTQHPKREAVFEQEVPVMAFDAGMPLDVVKHHFFFGARHVNDRRPVFDFLEKREASSVSGLTFH